MTNTRSGAHSADRAGGSRRTATTEQHDDEPSLVQLLANQNRLFERMVAKSENMGAAMAQQANQAPSKLADVQRTHPPHFSFVVLPVYAVQIFQSSGKDS